MAIRGFNIRGAGNGGTGTDAFDGKVGLFSELPDATEHPLELWIVLESSGVYFVNRREKGLYHSDGVEWKRLGDIPGFIAAHNDSDEAHGMTATGRALLRANDAITARSVIDAEPSFGKNTAFNRDFGSASGTVCAGDDARLSDARTPAAHAGTHASGGADELTPAAIGAEPYRKRTIATAAPTANNDTTEGYSVWSLWANTTTSEVYRCIDATAGAAEWVKTTLTIDELGDAATADIGTATGEVIGTDEAREYFGLDYETSVLPTISSDFSRNRHELYEQYGNEPKTILQMWDVARDTSGTYRDAAGVIRTAGPAEPRIDYDPVTGRAALLAEEARTNLLLNSETLSTQDVAVTNVAHTLHFTGTGTVTLSGAATGELVGTGDGEINRVALTFTPSEGTLTLTVSGSVKFSQLEAASTPSSYIPTEASQATRAADVVSRTLGDQFNPYEVTMTWEGSLISGDGNQSFQSLHSLTDGGVTNSRTYVLTWDEAGGRLRFFTYNADNEASAGAAVNTQSGLYQSGDYVSIAASYSRNEGVLILAVNGELIGSISYDVTDRMDEINTQLLCCGLRGLSDQGNTTAKTVSAKYIPRALSAAELQEMTKL